MADISITKFRVQIPRNGATPSTPGFAQSEGQDPVNPPGSPTGIYVPYLGATGSVNLGEFGLTSGFVTFDTTPTGTPTSQGTASWDDARQTVALIMNGTTQHIGQDQFFYVKNSSGSPIAKGVAVRFAGTDGGSGHILIAPFLADGTYPSAYFMGVTAEAIANGGYGQVMSFGELNGINTSTYTAGDLLYASTTVAGGFQTTAPVAPNNIVLVAAAINSKNNGDIIIRPTIGSNIKNDEGVKITSGTAGDLLQLQAGGLWENKSLSSIGISTGSGANGRVTFWTGTNTQFSDSNFIWDNTNKRLGIGVAAPANPIDISYNILNNDIGIRLVNTRTSGAGVSGSFINLFVNDGAATSVNDRLGGFLFGGARDSSNTLSNSAGIISYAAANWTSGSSPSYITFEITASGNTSRTRVFYVWSTGNVTIQNGGTFTDSGFRLDVAGTVRIQDDLTISDNKNLIVGTTNGTKIGTSTSQKISFWNATPIVQPTTAISESAFVENAGGTAVNDDSTFDGYTLRQIVKALRDAGLLA